ncbi:hypothetical protein BH10ACI3_BH10ACI3_07360 [soil metagenome]
MFGKNIIRKSVTLFTLAAVWSVYSMVAFAAPKDLAGEITVSGQVTVNGQAAVSNSTILSGAVITTADNSSAVISLGKTGRIEILANSNMTLRFSDNSIVAMLSEGKARVSNSAGVATTVTTKHTTVIADAGQADNFLVEVECSHTHVDTTAGIVTMREGSSDKQVVAGTTAVAGNMAQAGCKPCMRPNSDPGPSIAGWPWLILLAAGAAGVGIYLGTQNGDTNIGGGTIIVSPTR